MSYESLKEVRDVLSSYPLVRKAVQSLPLDTLCPFNDPRQNVYLLFIISFYIFTAIIYTFHARRRLIVS